MDEVVGEAVTGPWMVDDDEVELPGQHIDRHVAEFVQRALLPTNANAGMQFLVTLGGRHQRRQGAAVVPRDAGQFKHAQDDLT